MLSHGYFTQKIWTSAPLYRWDCTNRDTNYIQSADTEADARAKMLVYLLENYLIGGTSCARRPQSIRLGSGRRGTSAVLLAYYGYC